MVFSKQLTSTLSNFAILSKVTKSGCILLLHHLLTVQFDLPSRSASHLPVLPFSTSTTFSLLRFAIANQMFDIWCKINKILWENWLSHEESFIVFLFRPQNVSSFLSSSLQFLVVLLYENLVVQSYQLQRVQELSLSNKTMVYAYILTFEKCRDFLKIATGNGRRVRSTGGKRSTWWVNTHSLAKWIPYSLMEWKPHSLMEWKPYSLK